MASNQDFIFTLGADISQFTKSITEVEAELKSVKTSLKNLTGQALVEANRYVQQLEGSITNLRKAGLDKLPQAAQGGTAALFSLSQVARDAPFGFIAIQNNLPLVVDQFSALSKASGGLGGALKQVGSALVGPAGIAFAFGAVIAGVTSLVQKYGSLSAAFDAIIGGTRILTKEQKDFAKSLADEATEVISLATLYPKFEKDRQKQFDIIKKLNQVAPEYFGNLKAEKTSIDELTASLDKYIDSFIGKIYIESQQKKINELFTKYAEQITRLIDAELERKKGLKDTKTIVDGLGKSTTQMMNEAIAATKQPMVGDIGLNITPVFPKNTTQGAIDELKSELRSQLTGVFSEIDVFKGFINIDGLKQLKTNTKEVEGLWSGFAPAAVIAGDDFNNAVKKSAKNLEGWRYIIEQVAIKSAELKTNLDGVANTAIKISNTSFDQLFESLQNQDMLFGIQEVQRGVNKVFKGMDDDMKANQQRFENYKSVIENFITAPLDYLFNTVLEGGKFSWKEFGNVVLRVLANIISSIIATTAAAAIANAIVPGAGTAGVNAYNQSSRLFGRNMQGGMSPSLGYTPRGLGGAANFGGLSGGIGLSGQVVFVQRGSDLVGVLNRSNATINRVG
jgi:cell division septum initiation protein DivIVA